MLYHFTIDEIFPYNISTENDFRRKYEEATVTRLGCEYVPFPVEVTQMQTAVMCINQAMAAADPNTKALLVGALASAEAALTAANALHLPPYYARLAGKDETVSNAKKAEEHAKINYENYLEHKPKEPNSRAMAVPYFKEDLRSPYQHRMIRCYSGMDENHEAFDYPNILIQDPETQANERFLNLDPDARY